jgi:hypothetical protein
MGFTSGPPLGTKLGPILMVVRSRHTVNAVAGPGAELVTATKTYRIVPPGR